MKIPMKKGEVAKKILLNIAMAAIATGTAVTFAAIPGLGPVTKEIFDLYQSSDKNRRYRIRKTFAALRRDRLLQTKHQPDGSTIVMLSERGQQRILKYKFDDLALSSPRRWDGKWHIVIFDLPVRYEKERDMFRHKLKTLGFYQLNRSVWVHAFPCRDEIDFVTEYLNISPHVRLIEASMFDGSEEVEEFFGVG